MGIRYATVGDVKRIIPELGTDYGASSSLDTAIEAALDQASDSARQILISRYQLSAIESLSPLPSALVNYTAYKASGIFLTWEGFKGNDNNKKKIEMIWKMASHWQKQLYDKTILDSSNNPVAAKNQIRSVSEPQSTAGLNGLYEEGPRGRSNPEQTI